MWRASLRLSQNVTASVEPIRLTTREIVLTSNNRYALPGSATQQTPPQPTATRPVQSATRRNNFAWREGMQEAGLNGRRKFSSMAETKSWWKGSSKPAESQPPVSSFEAEPMNIPEETEAEIEQLPTRRVHILGLGSIGTLVAHSLQCLPNAPPLTLLLHKPELFQKFKQDGRIIRLINPNTEVNDEQYGYDVDVLDANEQTGAPFWKHIPNRDGGYQGRPTNTLLDGETLKSGEVYIYTLIVAVKGPRTVEALRSVKHRVNAQTTICLMQNGMGQIDELNREVFPDPETRPTYMLGIVSHGAHMSGMFTIIHAGFGTTALGIYRDVDKYPLPSKSSTFDPNQLSDEDRNRYYPDDDQLYSNLSSRYLLRTLTRSPVLACAPFPYLDLFQLQLEKLVMNSILNPLTALLNIPNGALLGVTPIERIERLLLAETSLVIRGLPELEGVPGVAMRFSPDRLYNLCGSIAKKTAKNSSSMREDVRKLVSTEINYINGYIVRRGEEQGIKCVLNYLLMKLIAAKTIVTGGGKVQPYGLSSIESTSPTPDDENRDDPVNLEDKGTQLKGETY